MGEGGKDGNARELDSRVARAREGNDAAEEGELAVVPAMLLPLGNLGEHDGRSQDKFAVFR